MWVELLQPVGEWKAGEFVDLTDDTAKAYVTAGLAKDAGDGPDKILMQRAVEEFNRTLTGTMKSLTDSITGATANLRRPGQITPGESEADKRKSATDYIRQVWLSNSPNPEERQAAVDRLTGPYGCQRTVMVEGTGSLGGYTTPVIYETAMFSVMAESAIVRPRARAVPLGARDVEWPALDQFQTPSKGTSAFFAGIQVYRKGENVQRTATNANLTKVKLVAQDLTALWQIGRDLLQDTTSNLDAMITTLVGQALGWREDYEALVGDATSGSTMTSILQSAAALHVDRGAAGTITYSDLIAMEKLLLPQSQGSAVWVAHPYCKAQFYALVDTSNRNIWLPNIPTAALGPVAFKPADQLLGRTVLYSEKLPSVANTGALMLCDFDKYLLGTRAGIEFAVSTEFAFDTDNITFRAKLRNDGQPWLKKPITLADGDGTNQVSAFVILDVHT